MGILDLIKTKDIDRQSVAYHITNETFYRLLKVLDLTQEYNITKYGPIRARAGKTKCGVAEMDTEKHEIILEKSVIDHYLNIKNELEKHKNINQEKYQKELQVYSRAIEEGSAHEITHEIRRRLLGEKSKEWVYNPTSRKVEEALADLVQSVFLDMNEDEIIYRLNFLSQQHAYTESGISLAKEREERLREIGKLGTDEKREIERQKRKYATKIDVLYGYSLGYLAALGMRDMTKEEKLKFLKTIIKYEDSKKILDRLDELGYKGIEVFKQNRRSYWEKNSEWFSEEERSEMIDRMIENDLYGLTKSIKKPENKPKEEKVGNVLILIFLAFAICGPIYFFTLTRKTTSMAVGVYNPNILSLIIFLFIISSGYLFLLRRKI